LGRGLYFTSAPIDSGNSGGAAIDVPMPTLLAKYALRVVVAPPLMVTPDSSVATY
jgi:hypothetical protein